MQDYRSSCSPMWCGSPSLCCDPCVHVCVLCCTNHAWMNSIGRERKQLLLPDQIRLKIVVGFPFSKDRDDRTDKTSICRPTNIVGDSVKLVFHELWPICKVVITERSQSGAASPQSRFVCPPVTVWTPQQQQASGYQLLQWVFKGHEFHSPLIGWEWDRRTRRDALFFIHYKNKATTDAAVQKRFLFSP
jgi:hypothetical protein